MLMSLFGDNKFGLLGKAISAFSGLSSGSAKSLLGVAAPMLLSLLSKKKKSDELDSGGLIDLLKGQKDNVAKALPPELGRELKGSGILEGLLGNAGANVSKATATATRATADTAQQAARQSKSLFSRLLPLFIIALLVMVAYQYFFKSKPVEETVKQAGNAAMKALTVEGIDLGKGITTFFENTGKALAGITDVESARKALPSLGEANKTLDGISSLAAKLPTEGRRMLAEIIGKLSPGLDTAIKTAYAIPGVGDVLGDTMNSLRQKLSALSKG
jgi:hypothetical protein